MKLLLKLLLAAALLLAACAPKPQNIVQTTVPPVASATVPPTVSPTAAPISPEETEARLRAMQPVLDSVLRTIGFIDGSPYSASDTEQFWVELYLMGANFGGLDARVREEEGWLIVPRQVMYEWASAFTEAFNGLPDGPVDKEYMRYDAAQNAYLLACSDMGDSSTEIERLYSRGDGTYDVSIGVYAGDGERLGGMDFVLVDNPFLGGSGATPLLDAADMAPVEAPVYCYTVRAATAQPAPAA